MHSVLFVKVYIHTYTHIRRHSIKENTFAFTICFLYLRANSNAGLWDYHIGDKFMRHFYFLKKGRETNNETASKISKMTCIRHSIVNPERTKDIINHAPLSLTRNLTHQLNLAWEQAAVLLGQGGRRTR